MSRIAAKARVRGPEAREVFQWLSYRQYPAMLLLLAGYVFGAMALGLLGAYPAENSIVSQLSLGLVAFGLGMVGLLKTAIEMREHHRLDKHPQPTERGNA